jgi:hypothetical protein
VSAAALAGSPGRGGINRGRGDAPMFFGDPSGGDTSSFEAKQLPEARVRDLEHSALLGVGAVAPTIDPLAESSGLAPTSEAAAKQAWQRRLAPRHRDSVKAFFRPKDGSSP